MFYVREVSGQIAPYAPGAVRSRRIVEASSRIEPVAGASTKDSSSSGSEAASAVVAAYERVINPDTPRRKIVLAEELMRKDVITIFGSATLEDAHRIFTSRRFRHIPVVDSDENLIGMLSDRDLLRRAARLDDAAHADAKPWREQLVESIMTKPVLVASSDTKTREIAGVMFEERIGCLPIVDESQKVVGIITRSDILRTLVSQAPLELWR